MRVAINGFGRIGRMVFRAGLAHDDIEFVAINDLTDTKTLAYLLKYDSVHGIFKGEVGHDETHLIVDGKHIPVFAKKDPEELPWNELNVDAVVESTGFFRTKALASKHITAGAKKVLLSAPGKGDDPISTVVVGVNHDEITSDVHICSNASCTTNSIAPIVKVIHDMFGVENGLLTTIHSYTADQKLVDAPHKDHRRGRSAALNIVPTSTGAAKAVAETIPDLKGKLDGRAIRVPTPCGSITDMTFWVSREVTLEEVKGALKTACDGPLKGIIEYSEEELVSSDIVGNPHSGILDSKLTQVNGKMIKLFSWYDNEWGYSNRMIDMIKKMG